MTRFDLPISFRNFLDTAVEVGAIDAAEAFCEGVAFAVTYERESKGAAISGTVERVLDAAFASRHHAGDGHRACVKAAEMVWKEFPESLGPLGGDPK